MLDLPPESVLSISLLSRVLAEGKMEQRWEQGEEMRPPWGQQGMWEAGTQRGVMSEMRQECEQDPAEQKG